ncbi:MAG TPA: toxin-antitoxin system YwqK family antitoxin [Saprospiraceae bacterium]|nr:toxin-antitoxin system YwqK family antitoxin [Saprospiraceae bacterium]
MSVRYPVLLFLFLALVFSCRQSRLVEKKNESGVVIERYEVQQQDTAEIRSGLYERFDDRGRLLESSQYEDGKLNGVRKLYLEGVLQSEETRVLDQYHGPYKAYHPNGQLQLEAQYVHDVMTGEVKVYYASGKIKEIVHFEDNAENGPFVEFYENGARKAEGHYKQSDGPVEDGELKLYDSTGTLEKIMNCQLGKCFTTWTKDSTGIR